MAKLIFLPIADQSNPARTCSTMAPAAPAACSPWRKRRSRDLATEHGKQVVTHLYGQEINSETYAIAKPTSC